MNPSDTVFRARTVALDRERQADSLLACNPVWAAILRDEAARHGLFAQLADRSPCQDMPKAA